MCYSTYNNNNRSYLNLNAFHRELNQLLPSCGLSCVSNHRYRSLLWCNKYCISWATLV